MRRRYLGWALAAAAAAGAAGALAPAARADDGGAGTADVLVMKDGRRLAGQVVAETDDGVTFRAGGTTRLYLRSDVERIEHGEPAVESPPPVAPPVSAAPDAPAPAPAAPAAVPPAREKKEAFGRKGKVLTDAARAWVRDLAARADTDDEQVRRSVAAALRALGPAAVPAIEEAAAGASPAAKDLLTRVAAEMGGRRADAAGAPESGDGPPAAGGDPPPKDAPGASTPAPDAGAAPPAKGPAPDAPRGRDRRGRAALDRLVADLELREDQRAKMDDLLGGIERRQLEILRSTKLGGGSPVQATAAVDAMRRSTLDAARGFLDAAQFDLFEDHASRYFDGLLLRLTRGEGKSPAAPPAGGDGTAPPK